MEKHCLINNKTISYTDRGSGKVIVLIHGYLETKEVWNNFAQRLSENFRVIAPDIPGHGNSNVIAETHDMDLMAETINLLLQELNIETCTIVGHSLGGYVMLAFAQLFPEKLESFVLLHSTVYADTDEKRKNRLREIEFIKQGKLALIVNTHLPKTFANNNVKNFSVQIEEMKSHTKKHNPEGVCALLRGMMKRPDRQELIKTFDKPMLFIFGERDNYIPIEMGTKMANLSKKINVEWLQNSGHMGFIEEESNSHNIIEKFVFFDNQ
jgi:pimeloyl-ACP methyl ester carboxylesterase